MYFWNGNVLCGDRLGLCWPGHFHLIILCLVDNMEFLDFLDARKCLLNCSFGGISLMMTWIVMECIPREIPNFSPRGIIPFHSPYSQPDWHLQVLSVCGFRVIFSSNFFFINLFQSIFGRSFFLGLVWRLQGIYLLFIILIWRRLDSALQSHVACKFHHYFSGSKVF